MRLSMPTYMLGKKNVSNATKEEADSQDHLGGLG